MDWYSTGVACHLASTFHATDCYTTKVVEHRLQQASSAAENPVR